MFITEIVVSVIMTVLSVFYVKKELGKGHISIGIVMVLSLTGLLFCQRYYKGYIALENLIYIFALLILYPLAWIDASQKIIPNKVLIFALICRILLLSIEIIDEPDNVLMLLKNYGIPLLFIAVFCGIALLIFKDGIGMGDVKLLLLMSIYFGTKCMFSVLFFAMVGAFFVALYLLIFKKA